MKAKIQFFFKQTEAFTLMTAMLIAVALGLGACSSKPKKDRQSVYTEDSDFLKQGREIEEFEDPKVKNKNPEPGTETKQKGNTVIVSKKSEKQNKEQKIKAAQKKEEKLDQTKEQKSKDNESELQKSEFPFKAGEKVVLSASFFGIEAGKITIGVDTFKVIEGQKVYNFYAVGKTSRIFSMVYRVNNKIESLWSPKLKRPISTAFDAKETKQKYKTRVYFDWKSKKAELLEEGWHKKKGKYREQKTWELKKSGQDIVSSIFYTRTLPLKVGRSYPVTVFEDAKVIDASVYVDRKEVLRTRVGKFKTIVAKLSFSTDGKFSKDGDVLVWLTDDEYRQVVKIESKIKIGTVAAKLHSLVRP